MGQGGSHWVHPSSPSSPGALRPELAEVGLVARPSAIRVLAPLHESKCKTRRLTSEYSDSRDLCARCAPRGAPAPPIRVCLFQVRLPELVLLFPLLVFLFLNEFRKRDTIGF